MSGKVAPAQEYVSVRPPRLSHAAGGAWPRPNLSILGYALCLTINSLYLWGGFFPFFPTTMNTMPITDAFLRAQMLSYALAFFGTMAVVYRYPTIVQRTLALVGVGCLIVGPCCLIAGVYLPYLAEPFAAVAGFLIGCGSVGFTMAWQRYFSAESAQRGAYYLLVGTVVAPLAFLLLHIMPEAVPILLTPLLLVPICGLCIILCTRTIDFGQAMFVDKPREHPALLRRFISDYWRSALATGSLGFVAGLLRSLALSDPAEGDMVNTLSMVGMALVALVILVAWRRGAYKVNLEFVFKILLPFMFVIVCVWPLLGAGFFSIIASASHAVFAFASLMMLLHCVQISCDRGMNPCIVYGFFGGVVYVMQDLGLLAGNVIATSCPAELQALVAAFVALALLLSVLYALVASKKLFEGLRSPVAEPLGVVEFANVPGRQRAKKSPSPTSSVKDVAPEGAEAAQGHDEPQGPGASARDLMSSVVHQQCLTLKETYGLTTRETEILELIVRGNTVSAIATRLVISENTVRTHSQHIYTKLDVHKRQEILDLLDKA